MEKLLKILISILAIGFITSCIVPESTHTKSSFHLLTKSSLDLNNSSRENKNLSSPKKAYPNRTFYLRQVELPYYLQENRIIFRPVKGKIEFRENERWGEPLEQGIGRVLGINLSEFLESPYYSVYPHRKKVGAFYEISITINRFERVDSSKVLLEGSWQLFTDDFKNGTYPVINKKEILHTEFNSFSTNTDFINEEVLALSKTLSILAGKITLAINSYEANL